MTDEALPRENVVKTGRFCYGAEPIGRVVIVETSKRPGSGDEEDTPEWRDDQHGTFYEVRYELRKTAAISQAGGGWYSTLAEAMLSVEQKWTGVIGDKS